MELRVTAVGQTVAEMADYIFCQLRLNPVNPVKSGKLGNLKTFTYIFEISEDEMIFTRRELMRRVRTESPQLIPMYQHGDSTRIYIFNRLSFK